MGVYDKMLADDMNSDNMGFMPDPEPTSREIATLGVKPKPKSAIKAMTLPILAQRLAAMAKPQPQAPQTSPEAASRGLDESPEAEAAPVASGAPPPANGGLELDPMLKRYIDEQEGNIRGSENAADEFGKKKLDINFKPLLGLIDSWTGSRISPTYDAPMTKAERDEKLAALKDKALSQRQKLTSDLVGLKKSQNTMSAAELKAMLLANREPAGMSGEDKELNRIGKEVRAKYDPASQTARNATGDAMRRKESINRLFGIAVRRPTLNFDKRQMEEFSTALASVISSGAMQNADSKIERLLPSTAKGKFRSWQEFLTSNPQGLDQQKFVKRMLHDVSAEDDNLAERFNAYLQGNDEMYEGVARSSDLAKARKAFKTKTATPAKYQELKQRIGAELDAEEQAAMKKAAKKAPGAPASRAPQAAVPETGSGGLTPDEQEEFEMLKQKYGG